MAGHPLVAALYDRILAGNEQAGLHDLRRRILAAATGRTLEIGSGTGANLDVYPASVTGLVLTEPDPHMARRLRARLEAEPPAIGGPVEVAEVGAERLPYDDDSFDTVVSTLALCTVGDPAAAVAEAKRVLRPGGGFLFIEHVRDEEGTRRARWQDRLERPWGWFAGSCHPNRRTETLITGAFPRTDIDRGDFPGPGTAIVKPLISGVARV